METIAYKGYSIIIEQDGDSESPRQWDNLGTMVCFHRRYSLGDSHKLTLDEAIALEASDKVIALPLYLYDHSGITIKNSPFSCPWDSGKVGFVYCDKEKAKKEYSVSRITKKTREKILSVLQGETKTYDEFLRGEVYYYRIEKDGETIDSLGGCYGYDYTLTEAKNYIDTETKEAA